MLVDFARPDVAMAVETEELVVSIFGQFDVFPDFVFDFVGGFDVLAVAGLRASGDFVDD